MTRKQYPFRPRVEELDRRDTPAIFGVPWPTPNLTLSFAPDGTDVDGSPSRLAATIGDAGRAEVLRAFQTWAAAANVNVGLVADGGQPLGVAGGPVHDPRFGDIRVAAAPLDGVVALALPFDLTAGTRSGDIVFNSRLPFGVGAGQFYDIFTTALHEAGHVFGLPGSADPHSVMADEPQRPRAALAPADAAGVVALYGPRTPDAYEGVAGNETTATAPEIQPAGGPGRSTDAIRATADLASAADTDVFKFRPNNLRGGGLTATVAVSGFSLLVPRLELLDAAGTVLASGVGGSPGAATVTLHLPTATDGATYYARVSAGAAAFTLGGYNLALVPDAAGSPGDDPIDPESGGNDTDATATTLTQLFKETGPRLDYALQAGLGSPTDVDVYRLRSPHQAGNSAGVLTVLVWAKDAPGLDPVVELTDRHGVPVAGTVLAHDGGGFTLQVPDAAANADFFVRVRHAHPGAGAVPGNYALAVNFGGLPVALPELLGGTLTAADPTGSRDYEVKPTQVLHLTLSVGGTAPAAGVRLSVLDAGGTVVGTRFALAGEAASLDAYLPAGAYRLRVEAATTDGRATPDLPYLVRGAGVSDPIGPRAVDVTLLPVGPPPPPAAPPAPPVVPPPAPPVVPPLSPGNPIRPVDPLSPPFVVTPPFLGRLTKSFSTGSAAGGVVRSFNPDGTLRSAVTPFAGYTGALRVAEADFTGDGVADLVVGTGPGAASRLVVLDGLTRAVLFAADPFEAAFTGGVFVTTGDVTGDGVPDLVVTPDEGGGPRVDVYSGAGFVKFATFFGIDDPSFRGGARAAVGDLNGDGVGDLVVAAGFGGGPRVAVFDGTSLGGTPRKLAADFFAFEPTVRNGVYVAAGDLDGDGKAELVAGGGPGGGPRVSAFGGAGLLRGEQVRVADFFAGDPAGRDGVRVAVKDLDGDALADLVIGGDRRVVGYAGRTLVGTAAPPELFGADAGTLGGVYVG